MPKQSNNQKLIKIGKEVCNNNSKDNYYAKINLNALQNAMIDLNTEASIKMWLYLAKNQNGYELALSSIDAIKWGIGSKSSYDRAVKALIDKGYLVKQEGKKDYYMFYEVYKKEHRKEDILNIKINKE